MAAERPDLATRESRGRGPGAARRRSRARDVNKGRLPPPPTRAGGPEGGDGPARTQLTSAMLAAHRGTLHNKGRRRGRGASPGRARLRGARGPGRGEEALPRPAGARPTPVGRGRGRRAGPRQRRRGRGLPRPLCPPPPPGPARRPPPGSPRGRLLPRRAHLPVGGERAADPGPAHTRCGAAANPRRRGPRPASSPGRHRRDTRPPPPLESAPRNGRSGSPLAAAAAAASRVLAPAARSR